MARYGLAGQLIDVVFCGVPESSVAFIQCSACDTFIDAENWRFRTPRRDNRI